MRNETEKKLTLSLFIKIWQTSKSLREVSEKTHLPTTTCQYRASKLKRSGVPLKKFPHFVSLDFSDIDKLIARNQKWLAMTPKAEAEKILKGKPNEKRNSAS